MLPATQCYLLPTPIPAGGQPNWLTIKPDQSFGVFVDSGNSDIQGMTNLSTTPTFPAASGPNAGLTFFSELVAGRENQFVYSADTNNSTISRYAVTTTTPNLLNSIAISPFPEGIWITPDGHTGFATSNAASAHEVVIINNIDTSTPTALPIPLPATDIHGTWPCVTPDQAPVARFSITIAPGNTALFDGFGSISPVGTIATWHWDFGDGNQETDTSPTTSHTYATDGPFTVTLTVTNSAGTSIASSNTFTGQVFSNHGADFALTQLVVAFAPSPPTNGAISQTVDKFLTQICYENTITWSPPTSGSPPVSYIIFSDAALTQVLGSVSASGPLLFVTCSKTAHATYYIVAIDATGSRSPPLVVSI